MSKLYLSMQNSPRPLVLALLPLAAVVFVALPVDGLAIAVLPLSVGVGMFSGAQFGACLLSRFWSGSHADRRGAKRVPVAGHATAAETGFLYLDRACVTARPEFSAALLPPGRGIVGTAAESFILTRRLSWALAIAGAPNVGKAMAWIGTPMFVAFAAAAPAGTALYNLRAFAPIAWATSALPLVTLASVLRMSLVVTNQAARRTASLRSVPGSVSGLPAVIPACSLGVASSLAISAALWARRHRGQIHEQPAT